MTVTVDHDADCNADVVMDVLDLPRTFCDGADVIWAANQCSTHSVMAGRKHRLKVGQTVVALSPDAERADEELEWTCDVFASALKANPKTKFVLENPGTGYMRSLNCVAFLHAHREPAIGTTNTSSASTTWAARASPSTSANARAWARTAS